MKKTTLKSLIEHIIRESIIDNLTNQGMEDENRVMGLDNLKHRKEFDAGRHAIMGTNVDESEYDSSHKKIYKDRQGGEDVYWMDNKDTGGKIKIRPEAVQKYIRQGYRIIDLQVEKIGFDGKYVDDMESGVAVKKLHKLDEDEVDKTFAKMEKDPTFRPKPFQPEEKPEEKLPGKFVNRGEIKLEGGIPEETARKIAEYHWDVFNHYKGIRDEWQFFTRGNRWCCSVGTLNGKPAMLSITTEPGRLQLLVGKELMPNKVKEQSGSGAAGGYSTPFGFKKKNSGIKENEFDGKQFPVHNAKVSPEETREAEEIAKKIWGDTVKTKFHSIDRLKGKHFWVTTNHPAYTTHYLCKMRDGKWIYSVGTGENSKWVPFHDEVNEMSSSGAAGGYLTPAAFTKNKKGSQRALNVTKKMGFTEV